MAEVFIGTSGFSYSHWRRVFYPENLPQKNWLAYYCQSFSTVEINSSFYHLPKKETFEKWRREARLRQGFGGQAGPNFVFAIKGWRWITHLKRLKNCQQEVKKFFEVLSTSEVEESLKDVILWQLPPGLKADLKRLGEFLEISFTPRRCVRFAFEFRNGSWLNDEVYDLLERYNASVVFQDFPEWPITDKITANFIYLRFHGKTSLYSSCYTKKELEKWAEKIKKWTKQGFDVYAYFNNDAMGYAVENAKTLKEFLMSNT